LTLDGTRSDREHRRKQRRRPELDEDAVDGRAEEPHERVRLQQVHDERHRERKREREAESARGSARP